MASRAAIATARPSPSRQRSTSSGSTPAQRGGGGGARKREGDGGGVQVGGEEASWRFVEQHGCWRAYEGELRPPEAFMTHPRTFSYSCNGRATAPTTAVWPRKTPTDE